MTRRDRTEFAVFSPPGEKLKLDVLDDKTNYEYRIETELLYSQKQKRSWELTVPPQKGIYSLKVVCVGTNRQIHINIFSTVPGAFIKNEHLNGYRIGKYPGLLTGKPFVTKSLHLMIATSLLFRIRNYPVKNTNIFIYGKFNLPPNDYVI